MEKNNALEYILKKDRLIVAGGLFMICLPAWLYIMYLYRQMANMNMDAFFFAMPMSPSWTSVDFGLLFLMWFVMMIAMMTPSVAPLILIFALVNRRRRQQQSPFVSTGYLLCGYFLIWAGFSLLATFLQWLLQRIAWLNPEMVTTNNRLAGIILIMAGIFQFTPLKRRCLNYCRTPVDFIHLKWKEGRIGALRMGLENGIYCLACCWILMALLFVAGIMNLLWIVLIALFVLAEKSLPKVKWLSTGAGILLMIYGILVLTRSLF